MVRSANAPTQQPGVQTLSARPYVFVAEIVTAAPRAGFADVRYVATTELAGRYLAGRSDGLNAAAGEGLLVART